jgi:hypothetical protein
MIMTEPTLYQQLKASRFTTSPSIQQMIPSSFDPSLSAVLTLLSDEKASLFWWLPHNFHFGEREIIYI